MGTPPAPREKVVQGTIRFDQLAKLGSQVTLHLPRLYVAYKKIMVQRSLQLYTIYRIYGSYHSFGSQLRSWLIRFHLKLHCLALSLQDLVVLGSEVVNLGVELRLHPWIWEYRHSIIPEIILQPGGLILRLPDKCFVCLRCLARIESIKAPMFATKVRIGTISWDAIKFLLEWVASYIYN